MPLVPQQGLAAQQGREVQISFVLGRLHPGVCRQRLGNGRPAQIVRRALGILCPGFGCLQTLICKRDSRRRVAFPRRRVRRPRGSARLELRRRPIVGLGTLEPLFALLFLLYSFDGPPLQLFILQGVPFADSLVVIVVDQDAGCDERPHGGDERGQRSRVPQQIRAAQVLQFPPRFFLRQAKVGDLLRQLLRLERLPIGFRSCPCGIVLRGGHVRPLCHSEAAWEGVPGLSRSFVTADDSALQRITAPPRWGWTRPSCGRPASRARNTSSGRRARALRCRCTRTRRYRHWVRCGRRTYRP